MSKAPAKPADSEAAPAGKSKKKLIVIGAAAVLLLGGIGGGAMYFMKKKPAAKEHKEEPAKAPVFLPLEPFVVNLQSEFGEKYLQVQMTLQVRDDATVNLIKANLPQVKSRLIMLLSSKNAEELLTPEGKDLLIQEITQQISLPFVPKGEPQDVSGVFFTSFVVQ
ncbi:flagellar basal body-associated protein FliL [Undibacterium fentianense]|uniref:Flagellar protein FliL n=1 Tax=Undibacterium fentianense TaxID=2828728 RepID=A0A941IDU5_9BURK|nr:flagellar basal body-associated protein FliL [Undibacterium fentianense]MBR7798946.1 flagellar basal body-associated protein FliL [Undibacterium fentianense]